MRIEERGASRRNGRPTQPDAQQSEEATDARQEAFSGAGWPDAESLELSPIRQQYLNVKRQYPDAILFFRLGDFYEMFDDDAELVARELELTLTRRDFGRGQKSPMAGVPHHAAEGYIARLIGKGYRVAICEQVSDPALSRGLVEREVLRVVTPGTVVDPAMLAAKRNNYLAAAVLGRDAVGVAYADITTGEFACAQFHAADPESALLQELARVQPAEALVEATRPLRAPLPRRHSRHSDHQMDELADLPEAPDALDADDEASLGERLAARLDAIDARLGMVVTPYDARFFGEDMARERLLEHFHVATLDAYGCAGLPLATRAAGAIIAYLNETQRGALAQITALETYSVAGFMTLDAHTRRNLEIFESGRSGSVKGSLLGVLDLTRTPMGGRLLRRWLGEPLLDLERLHQRQEGVAAAVADVTLRTRLAKPLRHVGDLERLANRTLQRLATPRDLIALASGLHTLEEMLTSPANPLSQEERGNPNPFPTPDAGAPPLKGEGLGWGLAHLLATLEALPELQTLIARALEDE